MTVAGQKAPDAHKAKLYLAYTLGFGYNLGLALVDTSAKEKRCKGGIAQLGERLHGMQEVSSSILLISTNNPPQNSVTLRKETEE